MADADELTVRVDLAERSYDILIASRRMPSFAATLQNWIRQRSGRDPQSRTALIVTDENVAASHAADVARGLTAAGWSCETCVLEPGEASKALEVVSGIYDRLIGMQADRQTVLVAVGGGVVGDAAGFAAATYARGIPFVQVPTTLLADVDSSVGGKVGINHPRAKNMIGAFHQPLGVFIDTAALDTLPDREYRSGLAEVVKYGVILDAAFFELLEARADELNRRDPQTLRDVIARCCRLKGDVVQQDEYERTGLRAILNYGHTFAHAFEALSGYGKLLHGEAVSIGMVYASLLAERTNLIDAALTERQARLLSALGLPTTLPEELRFTAEEVIERMRVDKKSIAGRLRFILPTRLGHVELFDDVPEEQVRAVLGQS